jgi:general secretion pathway protein L
MDRLTPFRADETYWACRITSRDSARGRLHVRIAIIPRARVTAILSALQRHGLVPTRIETTAAFPEQQVISITKEHERYGWLGPRANGYALGTCGALAITAVALPFILQAVAGADIESQIDTLRPQVALADGLRKKIVNHSTTSEAITAARVQTGAPLQSIALLTEALPDDTFLTSLNVRQRKIMISGRSAAAARLIGALAANPQFRNPAFTAPVIRDEASGGEMFSIRAELGS